MSNFEEAVIARLDAIIAQLNHNNKTIWAAAGVDIEHEAYKAKYRELMNRAKNPQIVRASLEDLGIEVEQPDKDK